MEVRERKLLRSFWFKSAERKNFDLFLFFPFKQYWAKNNLFNILNVIFKWWMECVFPGLQPNSRDLELWKCLKCYQLVGSG